MTETKEEMPIKQFVSMLLDDRKELEKMGKLAEKYC